MREKILAMLVLVIILSSLGTVSGGNDYEHEDLEDEVSYLDIPVPQGLEVVKDDPDIVLQWDIVEEVDRYKVYYSTDIYDSFPEDWESYYTNHENWTHNDALDSEDSYYYLVRGVEGEVEGRISNTGLCVRLELPYDPDSRLHYISVPDGFNNIDEPTASDIVDHIEGGTEAEHNVYIDNVVKWDHEEGAFTECYYHTSFGWASTDFLVEPQATVGLRLTDNLTWHVNAVESEVSMEFDYDPDGRLHYISNPYTMINQDKCSELTAKDVVLDIEGDLSSSNHVDAVVKWDYTNRSFTELYSYETISGSWVGDDFTVEPEAAVGLMLSDNLTWTPTLTIFESPTVTSVDIQDNVILEFSKDMNRTSVDSNIHSNNFDFTTNWINNHTLEIIPDEPFQPEIEYNLEINNESTCIYGNYLDGNSNGTAYRTDEDDYVLNFITGTFPEIEHESPSRWHTYHDIELSANISDDEGLDEVYINYNDVNGIQHNETLDIEKSNISISAQKESGAFSYYFYAVDTNGLTNKSEVYNIDILDLNYPKLDHVSHEEDVIPINGNMTLKFSKQMNSSSLQEGLTITPYLDHSITELTKNEIKVNITDAHQEIEYSIHLDSNIIKDEYDIYLDSDHNISFYTETPPDIIHQQEIDSVYKSSNLNLSIECNDEFGIKEVLIEYTTPNKDNFYEELSYEDDGWCITIPGHNRTGKLKYRFTAVDQSGLTTTTDNYSISILNPVEVNFKNITGETDESIKLKVDIINPVGVREAEIHYRENGVEKREDLILTEGNAGNGVWTTDINIDSEGEYEYSLVITDLDDETIVKSSPNNIVVEESSTLFDGVLLYLLPILLIAAAIGGILYYKGHHVEDISEEEDIETKSTEEQTQDHEVQEENNCTICFGELDGEGHTCSGCGNRYHLTCMTAIGECPICGNKDLNELGVDDGREE